MNLTERFKALVIAKTIDFKKYKELEELTEITAASWRSWWNRGGSPSGEMIDAVCKVWPEHAFWLATGLDDHEHGHNAPPSGEATRVRKKARAVFLARLRLLRWESDHPFSKQDQVRYFDAMAGRGSIDSEIANAVQGWIDKVTEISNLERDRHDEERTFWHLEHAADSELPI